MTTRYYGKDVAIRLEGPEAVEQDQIMNALLAAVERLHRNYESVLTAEQFDAMTTEIHLGHNDGNVVIGWRATKEAP